MGILSRLVKSITDDLDRRVTGGEGTAHGDHRLLPDHQLEVTAALAVPFSGEIVVGPQRGRDRVVALFDAAEAKALRDTTLTIAATAVSASGAGEGSLASLTAEFAQRDPTRPDAPPVALDTFSVEGRLRSDGSARLIIEIRLRGG